MKDIPVYRFPAEHARENGELELYRASIKANAACKEAIEKAISEHYCDNVPVSYTHLCRSCSSDTA